MAVPNRPLNQECIDIFRRGVEKVMRNWTALQICVDHGTGGPYSRELAVNLIQYIGDVFCEGENIEPEDVSDVLLEAMDTQFETLLEDNSQNEIAGILCKLYQLCLVGNFNELKREVDNLPVSQANQREWHSVQYRTVQNAEGRCPMTSVSEDNVEISNEDQEMEDNALVEPGWTQVTRRKRVP